MTIPASLSKLKSLFPVIVVGASVAITIKLLTESTPLTSEPLQVKAEEDIKTVEYKDELIEIKEPEPEPEPQKEEAPPPEEDKDKEQTDQQDPKEEDNKEESDSEKDPPEDKQENQKQDQSQQKPKSSGRAFVKGGIGDLLGKIFKSK